MALTWQQPLPSIYQELSDAELKVRISLARQDLGSRVVVLGHHYQQDDVVEFADFTGDSFELSRIAAQQTEAEFVIFCGVHFMAESADILTRPAVSVILPDLGAGCSMADMANLEQCQDAWAQIAEVCPAATVVPITYMNSSAAIKSFVGEMGGAVCTSSNARAVLEWALSRNLVNSGTGSTARRPPLDLTEAEPSNTQGDDRKVLFLPDQHLGRNTAYAMGYPLDSMIVWDPREPLGGNSESAVRVAKFILWKGHCSVHALFRPEHVEEVRRDHPAMKVVVHPECRWDVVQKADASGSTAHIVKLIDAAPPGSQWAIGTEVHLIHRLAQRHPEQTIVALSGCQCLCTTMFRIDLPHLCWVLEELTQGRVVNQIKVDDHTRKWATVALERMLAIKGNSAGGVIPPRLATVD